MSIYALMKRLGPKLRKGDLKSCVDRTVSALKSIPDSPFHIAAALEFNNHPVEVAKHFDNFIATQSQEFDLKAIYTETNGFDINPDRWFFDVFGYDRYGGHEDYDWLSDWKPGLYPDMTLTGMESLQEVYASDAFEDDAYREASECASLIVVLKFQQLIHRSAAHMGRLKVPLLATSHDYDFIYEFTP